jgi:hypothetical protein
VITKRRIEGPLVTASSLRVNVFDFEFLNAYLTEKRPAAWLEAWRLERLPPDTSLG